MSDSLDRRLAALGEAAEVGQGRLDAEVVVAAQAVVEKAGARLGLGLEQTVVALAGPTGAGKSTLFNELAGAPLSQVGVRRPTTSTAAAAVWGEGAEPLLDWLEVPRRHLLADPELDGLVLLDLPDFDSVESSHRLEVDRLIELVDLVVWVVDPQKYADAAWHEGYVRRLHRYAAAMAVVLNQSDLLSEQALASCRSDLTRLLERDGVARVPVLAVSAREGEGLEAMRALLADRVAAREAVVARLEADVEVAVAGLARFCAGRERARIGRKERERLLHAFADAAGVSTVVRAVDAAHRRRGALATGWPFFRWVRRLRPDPLRRLRLPEDPQESVRTSLPPPSGVQLARVETAARALADGVAGGLPQPWPMLVRGAATGSGDRLPDELDRAVAGADLHVRRPRWWRLGGFLQTAFAAAVAVGALWLLALLALDYLRLDDVVPVPEARGVELPTALFLGGIVAGIALAFLARIANGIGARRRARAAGRAVRARLEGTAEKLVVEPVERELAAYERLCAAVAKAGAPSEQRRSRRRLAPV